MDSFTTNEENPWKNEMVWKKGIIDLNDTLDRADEAIKRGNNGLKIVREIRKYEAEPVVIDLVNEEQETPKRRKVTFNIEYGKCTQAIDEVLKSLEIITGIDINTLVNKKNTNVQYAQVIRATDAVSLTNSEIKLTASRGSTVILFQ